MLSGFLQAVLLIFIHTFIHLFVCSFIHSFLYLQKGMINYLGRSFLVQPLPAHLVKQHGSSGGSRPHLIYRRSLEDIKNKCDISGEIMLNFFFGEMQRVIQKLMNKS